MEAARAYDRPRRGRATGLRHPLSTPPRGRVGDPGFIVTNLAKGTSKALYEKLYCARGPSAASWPRSLRESDRSPTDDRWPRTISKCARPTSQPIAGVPAKPALRGGRTSCTSATANQLRLFLHAGAYWLMWTLRAALPPRSAWRHAQFDTLRLELSRSPPASSNSKPGSPSTCPPPAWPHPSSGYCSSACRAWRPPDARPDRSASPPEPSNPRPSPIPRLLARARQSLSPPVSATPESNAETRRTGASRHPWCIDRARLSASLPMIDAAAGRRRRPVEGSKCRGQSTSLRDRSRGRCAGPA